MDVAAMADELGRMPRWSRIALLDGVLVILTLCTIEEAERIVRAEAEDIFRSA